MKDNSTAQASEVMPELIKSVVEDVIENPEGLDLYTPEGVEDAVAMIIDYLEASTGEKVTLLDVAREFQRQWGFVS